MGRPGFVQLEEGGSKGVCVPGAGRGLLAVSGGGPASRHSDAERRTLGSWARASGSVL